MKSFYYLLGVFAVVAALCTLDAASAQDKGHDHPETGPHKGVLAEWGEEEYHVEIVIDSKTKEATAYILDGTAKKAKPIAVQEVTLTLKQKPAVTVKLKAKADQGDAAGTSSRFVGTNDAFAKHQDFEGTVSAKIGNKPYSGDFKMKHSHEHK